MSPKLGVLGRGVALCVVVVGGVVGVWLATPPSLPPVVESARVLDRHGALLSERPAPERARGEALAAPPETLARAIIAAEDRRFMSHVGVDPRAIARAALANLRAGEVVQGGSTLTQQLVRTLWTRPPGLRGKLWEAAWAVRLELHLNKSQILSEYLNRVYLGGVAYGVDAAARTLYDKRPEALSVAEAALIAALPRRPGALDPFRDRSQAKAARDRVLTTMLEVGLITAEEHGEALEQPLGLRREPPMGGVWHLVRRLNPAPGALTVTLDARLQKDVEALVRGMVASLREQAVSQAAAIVVDRQSGEVLAYVGSVGFDSPGGQVDGVMAPRSPGSALKPFIYQLGLERGHITLATPLMDLPQTWTTTHGAWTPTNYDERHHGPVLAREALARSLNIPAVRVLEAVGVASLHHRLVELGVTTLDERPDHYGLGLALGDAELRLDELTAAYLALANGGRARPLVFRADDPRPVGVQVGEARAAALILDALDDDSARAGAFGLGSVLEPSFEMAAKTGTSVGWRDNWAFGITGELVIGVWVGNFDGAPMREVSGITGAAPLLRAIAERAQLGLHDQLPRVKGLIPREICPLSGALVGPSCPGARLERFLPGTAPDAVCPWHVEVPLDDSGALAVGCPNTSTRLVVRWPAEAQAWAAEANLPRWPERDNSCVTPEGAATTTSPAIVYPGDGLSFFLEPDRPAEHQAIPLRAAAPSAAKTAIWRVDGVPLPPVGPPFSTRWPLSPGAHTLSLSVDGVEAPTVRVYVGSAAAE
ncbi:MAG: penicillin-binding protein 1C [Deltaproteobacteria bacterium]|nr:penicillin-binding protein 1C [Deltaproteobacteria bacterium]